MSTCRRTRRDWERLFAEVERTGSVVEVARRRGVNERTLSWWCWKLRGEQRRTPPLVVEPRLLPVVVRDTALAVMEPSPRAAVAQEVVVEFGTVRVRLPAGVDIEDIARLARALAAC